MNRHHEFNFYLLLSRIQYPPERSVGYDRSVIVIVIVVAAMAMAMVMVMGVIVEC